jgi:hypothetical protein
MIVMAVDPGQTTGWVISDLREERMAVGATHMMVKEGLMNYGQVGGGTTVESECKQARFLLQACEHHEVELVVMESFFLFPDQGHSPDPAGIAPVRIISRFEMINWLTLPTYPITFQTPSEKSVITDERLRRWGLWKPGKPHANDAMRHLCVFARKWAP